jgi:HlyD family secretion protein
MTIKKAGTVAHDSVSMPSASGAGMDVRLPKRKRSLPLLIGGGLLAVAGVVFSGFSVLPHGLVVSAKDVNTAAAQRGVFRDDITVRASAAALNSIVIDAVDRGRVEAVFVKDGALVKGGQLLFRLSNPQRRMDLLQRQSEQTQQISNLSNFNVSFESARIDSARRLNGLEFEVREAEKQQARNEKLVAQGFIAQSLYQDSTDKLTELRRQLQDERVGAGREAASRRAAIQALEDAVKGMHKGMLLFNESIDALAVRAPAAGRLADFRLQVGEAVKADQRIGRIDELDGYKLTAQVDEYYLPRIAVGHRGCAVIDGKDYGVEVKAVFQQIKEGRFTVEFSFENEGPAHLNPGLSVDLKVTLGEPKPALILPSGAFLGDSGGAWAFVLDSAGTHAQRRAIRLGRRSNTQVEVLDGLKAGERVIVSSYAAFGKAEELKLSD